LGALPLFLEERPRRRRPFDCFDLPVAHHDPLDHDPTELFPARREGCGDCVGERQDACPVAIEGGDPVAVR
jgi:hypothetical protein